MDESLRKITSPIIGINLSICFVFSLKKRESLVRFYIETEKTTNININCKIHFSDEFGSKNWGAIFASVSMSVFPLLILYMALNKKLMEGMTAGAVKG